MAKPWADVHSAPDKSIAIMVSKFGVALHETPPFGVSSKTISILAIFIPLVGSSHYFFETDFARMFNALCEKFEVLAEQLASFKNALVFELPLACVDHFLGIVIKLHDLLSLATALDRVLYCIENVIGRDLGARGPLIHQLLNPGFDPRHLHEFTGLNVRGADARGCISSANSRLRGIEVNQVFLAELLFFGGQLTWISVGHR